MYRLAPLCILLALTSPLAAAAPDPLAAAIDDLSSDTSIQRQHAFNEIESLLTAQSASLLATDDLDALLQINTALQYNQHLAEWLKHLTTLSPEIRHTQLQLLARKNLQLIWAKLFSDNPTTRAQAIHDLAPTEDADLNPLLNYFLNDPIPLVSIAAMDVIYDRPLDKHLLKTLWSIALADAISNVFIPIAPNPPVSINFHGTVLTDVFPPYTFLPTDLNTSRCLAAREVLVHFRGPEVESLLNNYLDNIHAQITALPTDQLSVTYRLPQPLNVLCAFTQRLHFRSSASHLYALATTPLDNNSKSIDMGQSFFSVRTHALATLLLLTNQNPTDYGFTTQGPDNYISPSKAVESQAVEKLTNWWKQHANEFTAHSTSPQPLALQH